MLVTGVMRAVVAAGYGPLEGLAVLSLPVPRPGYGQIQVRVHASALNPAEVRVLDGTMRDVAPLIFLHVVGRDFAGTVTETGDGVTRFAAGDEAFGFGFPLDGLAARALDGSLPEAISRRYRLEDGGRACVAFLHEHTRGKVVVVVSEGVAADRPGDL